MLDPDSKTELVPTSNVWLPYPQQITKKSLEAGISAFDYANPPRSCDKKAEENRIRTKVNLKKCNIYTDLVYDKLERRNKIYVADSDVAEIRPL